MTLFTLATKTYGHIDVVIANAGVGEIGKFDVFDDVKRKEPTKPCLVTGNVNTIGVLYSE